MTNDKLSQDISNEEADSKLKLKRRQVLHMGWTAPVIAALALKAPNVAFAESGHADHADYNDHVDGPHADHSDHTDAKKHYDSF